MRVWMLNRRRRISGKEEENKLDKPQAGTIVAELTIKIDVGGNVSLSGPMENRMICYGLLSVARDMIFEMHMKKGSKKKIQLAPATLADALRRPGN